MALWLRLRVPSAEGLDSIPGWGTRSHTLQLRVHMPQLKKKKIQMLQIKFFLQVKATYISNSKEMETD